MEKMLLSFFCVHKIKLTLFAVVLTAQLLEPEILDGHWMRDVRNSSFQYPVLVIPREHVDVHGSVLTPGETQPDTGWHQGEIIAPAQPAARRCLRTHTGESMASKLINLFIYLIKLEWCHQRVSRKRNESYKSKRKM